MSRLQSQNEEESPAPKAESRENPMFSDEFPRSNQYDPTWILTNARGPHPLWFTELLIQGVTLRPGMRVLDLGCGKGLSSIFIAKEFGAQVWALDVQTSASDNYQRAVAAGVGELVFPIRGDARQLPFGADFFDCVVSCNSYYLFGTDETYLGYLAGFIRPGGVLAIINPGLVHEKAELPRYLFDTSGQGPPLFDWSAVAFHSAEWWSSLMSRTPCIAGVAVESVRTGWELFLRSETAYCIMRGTNFEIDNTVRALREDQGRTFCFVKATATISKSAFTMPHDEQMLHRVEDR